jgi:hypothetical protein
MKSFLVLGISLVTSYSMAQIPAAPATPLDPTVACLQSACGAENPLPHPFEKSKESEAWTKAMIQKTMKKPLEQYMGRIIHRSMILDGAYRSLLTNKDPITLSAEQTAFAQSMRYGSRLGEFAGAIEMDAQGKYILNKEKLKAQLKTASEDELNALVSLSETVNVSIGMSRLASLSFDAYAKAIYPVFTLSQTETYEAVLLGNMRARIVRLVPLFATMHPDSIVVAKALKGEPLSEAEQKFFLDQIRNRYVIDALLAPAVQSAFAKLTISSEELLNEAQFDYLSTESAGAFRTPTTIKKFLNDGIKDCADKLAYSYAALPNRLQIKDFNAMYDEVKNKARQMVEEKIKASVPDSFKLNVILPPARETMIAKWQADLTAAIRDSESSIGQLKKINLKEAENRKSVLMVLALFKSDKMFSDVLSFCEAAKPPYLNDFALPDTAAVNLSWPTIVHPQYGLSIVAHEIGHVVSRTFPLAVLQEKLCLNGKKGVAQFAEEDFADLFAAEIYNRTGGKVKAATLGNLGCALSGRDAQGWMKGEIKNPLTGDSHSSGFYRLLAFGAMTKKTTPECAKYLVTTGEKRFDAYCGWQK